MDILNLGGAQNYNGIAFNPIFKNFAVGGINQGEIQLLKIDYSTMKLSNVGSTNFNLTNNNC